MAVSDLQQAVGRIEDFLRRAQLRDADTASAAAVRQWPSSPEAWMLAARTHLALGRSAAALDAAERARTLAPNNVLTRLLAAEAMLNGGKRDDGLVLLSSVSVGQSVAVDQKLGQLYTLAGRHEEAVRAFRAALEREPDSTSSLANLAISEIALGNLKGAEALFDQIIRRDPANSDAIYNRATLRRQTEASNHVEEIERTIGRGIRHPMDDCLLHYALAKELEDLGEYARSFAALRRGADARRRMLSYRVEDDSETMAAIAATLGSSVCGGPGGYAEARPIFILGLPRSGTTLVERIIGSHSMVESAGETTAFAQALIAAAGPAANKFELVRRSAAVDFAALGRECMQRLGSRPGMRIIDKTPANYLYLGLISRALPNAAIIHVTRDAMDSCYAMYKTLFRMAYPFSYDLNDLARYYGAYASLMAHWREAVPGRFLEIAYEDLISGQEAVTRRLLAHCGLGWEDSCLTPERNTQPSLTASAAQIRQPLYSSSVGLWKRYRSELAPLEAALTAQGLIAEA